MQVMPTRPGRDDRTRSTISSTSRYAELAVEQLHLVPAARSELATYAIPSEGKRAQCRSNSLRGGGWTRATLIRAPRRSAATTWKPRRPSTARPRRDRTRPRVSSSTASASVVVAHRERGARAYASATRRALHPVPPRERGDERRRAACAQPFRRARRLSHVVEEARARARRRRRRRARARGSAPRAARRGGRRRARPRASASILGERSRPTYDAAPAASTASRDAAGAAADVEDGWRLVAAPRPSPRARGRATARGGAAAGARRRGQTRARAGRSSVGSRSSSVGGSTSRKGTSRNRAAASRIRASIRWRRTFLWTRRRVSCSRAQSPRPRGQDDLERLGRELVRVEVEDRERRLLARPSRARAGARRPGARASRCRRRAGARAGRAAQTAIGNSHSPSLDAARVRRDRADPVAGSAASRRGSSRSGSRARAGSRAPTASLAVDREPRRAIAERLGAADRRDHVDDTGARRPGTRRA